MVARTAPDADAAEALRRAWERHAEERARVGDVQRRALAEALKTKKGEGGLAAQAGQGAGGRTAASGGTGQGGATVLSDLRAELDTQYLNTTREAPRSASELKAGSVIPGVMVTEDIVLPPWKG